jgi:hypothetical protein
MRQACVILASACLVLLVGCRDYDIRLEKTLEEMKYQQKVERNLEKAPTKGALQSERIYVRPPKGLTGPTQTFSLVAVEPGKFDLENSFIDQATKQVSLHILARHKKPKPPPKKGTPAAEAVPRGEFTQEVIDVVKAAYAAEDLTPAKFKAVSKRHEARENNYKEAKLDLAAKEVLIYIYGDKNSAYNVALIFEYPKTQVGDLSTKINLSLENFAVDNAADNAFAGSSEVEGSGEGGGGGGAAGAGQAPPV